MKYSEIMKLPIFTAYTTVWQLLYDSVSDTDVAAGTNRECFAYAHTIAWAVTHKHYINFMKNET